MAVRVEILLAPVRGAGSRGLLPKAYILSPLNFIREQLRKRSISTRSEQEVHLHPSSRAAVIRESLALWRYLYQERYLTRRNRGRACMSRTHRKVYKKNENDGIAKRKRGHPRLCGCPPGNLRRTQGPKNKTTRDPSAQTFEARLLRKEGGRRAAAHARLGAWSLP